MEVFMTEGVVISQFPIDDAETTASIQEQWRWHIYRTLFNCLAPLADQVAIQPLNSLAFYYGPAVGWYFAFMTHLISWLSIPSSVGLILGLYMIATDDFNSKMIPIYAIMLAMWSTLFIESWTRR
jgi:hypothetical protein